MSVFESIQIGMMSTRRCLCLCSMFRTIGIWNWRPLEYGLNDFSTFLWWSKRLVLWSQCGRLRYRFTGQRLLPCWFLCRFQDFRTLLWLWRMRFDVILGVWTSALYFFVGEAWRINGWTRTRSFRRLRSKRWWTSLSDYTQTSQFGFIGKESTLSTWRYWFWTSVINPRISLYNTWEMTRISAHRPPLDVFLAGTSPQRQRHVTSVMAWNTQYSQRRLW